MADDSIQRATARLRELGVSETGTGQLLSGQAVADENDRRIIADVATQLLGGLSTLAGDTEAASADSLQDPGTSKVKTRILGTNYDG